MVDRIDSSSLNQARKLDTSRSGAATKSTGAAPVSPMPQRESTVETSLLQRTSAEIANSDGVDRQKVEEIKNAIRNGEFSVDADEVAKAFIDLEMLASR